MRRGQVRVILLFFTADTILKNPDTILKNHIYFNFSVNKQFDFKTLSSAAT